MVKTRDVTEMILKFGNKKSEFRYISGMRYSFLSAIFLSVESGDVKSGRFRRSSAASSWFREKLQRKSLNSARTLYNFEKSEEVLI